MASTYSFDANNLSNAIRGGVANGMNRVAIVLAAEVRKQLSQPGSGRVYLRKSNAKTNYQGISRSALRLAGGRGSFRRLVVGKRSEDGGSTRLTIRFASISRADAAAILRENRASGKRNRSLRSLGFHKASAPGQPPAADTGDLRRSWQVGFGAISSRSGVFSGGRYVMKIGSALPYSRRLEFGGGAIAPRPYLRPACDIVRPKAGEMVAYEVEKALRKFARRRTR